MAVAEQRLVNNEDWTLIYWKVLTWTGNRLLPLRASSQQRQARSRLFAISGRGTTTAPPPRRLPHLHTAVESSNHNPTFGGAMRPLRSFSTHRAQGTTRLLIAKPPVRASLCSFQFGNRTTNDECPHAAPRSQADPRSRQP